MKAKSVSLADVAATPADDEEMMEDDSEESGEYDVAVSELADVIGVGSDDLAAFKSALQAVIMTCK